ncbi:sulfite exporter TauE/SafE family protein [Crenobacter cavernae]|uniref:Probable membrane transporter protein n=1 Tax=Crenobacter cavernae TaxID=2290923 RepID=A0ABY0FED9_9NEIS|nr:sulfite exporter TauE/SafE family protein [Crenobacter cavernae]RXZ44532.1 sulfite exporter TauE/SafE family protein [Crenobacter cavernae]
MSTGIFLLVAATVAVAAFIQGTVGVGFALVVAPVVGMVAPELLPVALLILMLPLNCYVTWREHPELDKTGAGWITAGRTVGALIGLWIIAQITQHELNLLIGASTILAAVISLCAPSFAPGRKAFMAAGVVTGVTETATGIGGPALAMVYQHQRAPILRSTIALCFALGEIISLVLLCAMGRVTPDLFVSAIALVPAVVVGAYLSRFSHHRFDGKVLRTSVMAFAIVSGTVMLYQSMS